MPKLVIDDHEIEVAPGTKVIEAAEQLGIMIPRFCYHPALGSVGACRVCAVKFLQGPFKGVQMSCMIDAKDDMVVSTTDEEAVDFRKHVIEWLMLHHPHDCPVCDEGGHCLLQDMTVSGGHGSRRYLGKKRTYPDQYLGPLIQHEMNRCIHCYRCSRYYQDFTGYQDLGVMQIANHTYFGRFKEGRLESPFSGNLADLCPTGVYTDKPSRYFGRRWDYQRSPSICINCSLGCHTIVSARNRELKRQEARFSQAVNGYFICDRGRYGFFYASLETRPRQHRLNGGEVSHAQALEAARNRLAQIDASAVAVAGSARNSLETQTTLKQICQRQGWRDAVFFMDSRALHNVQTAIARLEPHLVVSLRALETADLILNIGTDPINEAPMLALAMRQAQRNGARIVHLDPRPVSLPFEFLQLAVPTNAMSGYLAALIQKVADSETANRLGEQAAGFYESLPRVDGIAQSHAAHISNAILSLKKSQRPVIVCGTDIVADPIPGLAADLALFLHAMGKKSGLFYVLPGANAFGAGVLSGKEQTLLQVIEGIENGLIKALILVESDPWRYFADRPRLVKAFEKLELLIVLDYIGSGVVQAAHIFIPSATMYEAGGVFINQEGRLQRVPAAFAGGIPIAQTGRGDHPPRRYGTGLPGGETFPAWTVLAELAALRSPGDRPAARTDIWRWLAEFLPGFAELPAFEQIPAQGVRCNPGVNTDLRFATRWPLPLESVGARNNRLELIRVDWTFGTEELSWFSECLRELEQPPCIFMHSRDAGNQGLGDGDQVAIRTDKGLLETRLRVAENMAGGVVIVPRHAKINWQIFATGARHIFRDQIRKVTTQ